MVKTIMRQVKITSLGQIVQADISFGDMTVFVGQQASGKSILLQLIKLILDSDDITKNVKRQGFDWRQNTENFLSLYFGEGMQGIWKDSTNVLVDGKKFEIEKAVSKRGRKKNEALFLIPAQRVMTLKNGWPRSFTDYDSGDPYVVKQFSEQLRLLMESGLGSGKTAIFPQIGRMNKAIRDAIEESIFGGAKLKLDRTGLRKRIVLDVAGRQLPFMVWSAGQREFVPLLIGLYWLMPSSKATKKNNLDWVVIEEPEMGLHPQAISALLITFLELMRRGYKVIISTHSPQILELIWAIQSLIETKADPDSVLKIFNLKSNAFFKSFAKTILEEKTFKTYYFSRQENVVNVQDISTLNPASLNEAVSDWGGLTTFSTKVSEIVSEAVQEQGL
jgi:energy-coupling factor transporter ATP-binding protein EcfA2